MSRPPISRAAPSPRGLDTEQDRTAYFGPRFADLVALAETLARDPNGVAIPGSTARLAPGIVEIPGKDRGLARTLVEIPALFAHILGEHQSHYAAEAFLGTATRADSLIRHGRKLAYVPDQGVAATGLAVFTVKPGLTGDVPVHFALQSEPRGAVKSQTYETLAAAHVRASWNAIRPAAARRPTPIVFKADVAKVPIAAPAALTTGDIVLLRGQGKRAVCEVVGLDPKTLHLRRLSKGVESTGTWPAYSASDPYVILARPETQVRIFGHAADPVTFPPTGLASPALYTTPTDTRPNALGYSVTGLSSGSYTPGDSLILAEAVETPAAGADMALVRSGSAQPLTVTQSREAAVSFLAGALIAIPQPDPAPKGFPTTQLVERSISARATLLDLAATDGSAISWKSLPLDGTVYMGWTHSVAVVADQPNPAPLTATVVLDADLDGVAPGRQAIVKRISDGFAAAAVIQRLDPVGSGWQVTLSFQGGAVASAFTMGDTVVHANAVPVSHGETTTEVLGASDGVTPHQEFLLRKPGVTRISGAEGSRAELEVRVNGVLWDLVEDFHDVPPEGRVASTRADADQALTVRFGGEGRGAVPPSGARNITADYRTGLGRVGDAEAGRLTRIRKASPILGGVTNPLPLSGGTDPAGPDDMRRQATRPILTFDRAVSLQDHADLALLFPGVARAAARWLDRGAIELIAADATGAAPTDSAGLRAFLDARRDTQVPLALLTPQPVDVGLTLRVERDRAWLADAVRKAVRDLLLSDDADAPGLFTFAARSFSQPQSLSGVYSRILDLDGVTGLEAARFAVLPGTGVADILHATDRQWLRLAPGNLVVDVVDPGALIPDLQGGAA
jgi:predicted phage baseplate assembly protein